MRSVEALMLKKICFIGTVLIFIKFASEGCSSKSKN